MGNPLGSGTGQPTAGGQAAGGGQQNQNPGAGLAQYQQNAAINEAFLAALQRAQTIHDTNKAALQKTV